MSHRPPKAKAKFCYHLSLSGVRPTLVFCLFYVGSFEKCFLLKTGTVLDDKKSLVCQQDWEHPHIFWLTRKEYNVRKHPSLAELPLF